jgi:hypothetical protein
MAMIVPPADGRRIAEQNEAYRRGVVLGLTMAEAGILIIFVLLLLIGFDEWNRSIEREKMKGKATIPEERLKVLQRTKSSCKSCPRPSAYRCRRRVVRLPCWSA